MPSGSSAPCAISGRVNIPTSTVTVPSRRTALANPAAACKTNGPTVLSQASLQLCRSGFCGCVRAPGSQPRECATADLQAAAPAPGRPMPFASVSVPPTRPSNRRSLNMGGDALHLVSGQPAIEILRELRLNGAAVAHLASSPRETSNPARGVAAFADRDSVRMAFKSARPRTSLDFTVPRFTA